MAARSVSRKQKQVEEVPLPEPAPAKQDAKQDAKQVAKQSAKKQRKQKADTSSSEEQPAESKFSPTIIINFLNNYLRNANFENEQDARVAPQHIVFKEFPKDEAKAKKCQNVIDLDTYDGLKLFAEGFKQLKSEVKGVTFSDIIGATFDPKLRGFLHMCEYYKLRESPEVLRDHIVPHLRFAPQREITLDTFVDAINAFFANDDKIKTKIYNNTFPHGVHDVSKPAKGVNVIYLQHIAKYHDSILKNFIEEGKEPQTILKQVQTTYATKYEVEGMKANDLKLLREQLKNPLFLERTLEPIRFEGGNHKGAIDNKWIDKIEFDPKVGKELLPQVREAVRALVRELSITNNFLAILQSAKDVAGSDLTAELAEYRKVTAQVTDFKAKHKSVKKDYKGFLTYLVESARFVKDVLRFQAPLKILASCSKIQFRFEKKLRQDIEALIKDGITDEKLNEVVEAHADAWEFINSPRTYDVNSAEVYSKIGKYVGVAVTKEYRVAVGLAIVSFIQDELRLIRAVNKKKHDLVVHIKA